MFSLNNSWAWLGGYNSPETIPSVQIVWQPGQFASADTGPSVPAGLSAQEYSQAWLVY